MAEYDNTRWQLDKHIPIAVVIGIVIQTVSFVWWAATLEKRVEYLEQQRIEAAAVSSSIPDRITRLEVQLEHTNSLLKDLIRASQNYQR